MAHRDYPGGTLHLPALADIARDDHPFVVVQKSAQVGLTELMINRALWVADTGYADRGNVLFLMPTQNMMDDFAQGRFDRAIQDSPYLRARLQPEPPRRKAADSKRLKRVGPGYIYLRGADSRRQIASVDADLVLLDEYDQMGEGVLELAQKRLASSRAGRLMVASTPRLPEAGVNALYLQSDQRRYHIPCLHCDCEQTLTWQENVDLERALVVCRSCREPMDVTVPGRWVPEAPGNDRIHGYHLSRLYSTWANIAQMIEASQATTPAAQQEFYNSDLGEVFSPPGGGLSLDVLDRCRYEYDLEDYAGQPCVMGIDVGTKLHVVVRERPSDEQRNREQDGIRPRPRLLWGAGTVDTVEQLDELWRYFHVEMAVIDSQPEMRLAVEFQRRHPDRVLLARYGRQEPGYVLQSGPVPVLSVNRTQLIDETFERFRKRMAALPRDARQRSPPVREGLGEYYRELLAPQRTLERDADGNWVARWLDHNKADHYAHAEVYALLAELALPEPFICYTVVGLDCPSILAGLEMEHRY